MQHSLPAGECVGALSQILPVVAHLLDVHVVMRYELAGPIQLQRPGRDQAFFIERQCIAITL